MEDPGALQVTSLSQALADVRQEVRKYVPAGQSLVEELIQDRRVEVEREDEAALRT